MKTKREKNDAVTEVIGTMLLLTISLALFSIVYISVLSVPSTPPVPSAHIVLQIDGAVLSLGHNGGDSLDLDTEILISANDTVMQTTIGDISGSLVWDENNDNQWGMGEVLTYSSGDFLGSNVELNIIDPESNAIVMRGSFKVTDQNFTLTVQTSGDGSVLFDPPLKLEYSYGETVELTANANSGWNFGGWTGDENSEENPLEILMDENKVITAVFTEECYTLDITIMGNGDVSKNPNKACYDYNDDVELNANADPGWNFGGWTGDLSGSGTPETITMDGNKAVTATFTQDQYNLIVTQSGSGSGTVEFSPSGPYNYGDTVTIWANASTGSVFGEWTGDLSGSSSPDTITMDSAKSVNAVFLLYYDLDVNIVGDGSVSLDPPGGIYADGTIVELTANADDGYLFDEWSGDLSGDSNPETVTVNADKSVTATFVDANIMHVDDIEMDIGSFIVSRWGIATVTIVDGEGNPIENAIVEGQWSGLTSDSESGPTDSQGRVQFTSSWVGSWQSGTFTFTVTDVTKTGWTYDAAANVETSDSVSV